MTERRIPSPAERQALIDWYEANHRDLPWRQTRDPYRILVSEIMLQQTQAERVIPKYRDFLTRFPTLQALADAPASEVIRAWAGLGYNRRALNLQRACRVVVEEYGGEMPSEPALLAKLPGIGPYTAGAVACFAFEKDVAFVDTNIRRVIHRVVAGPELPEPAMTERGIVATALNMLPAGRGYLWNQALMELGATICRARMTSCERCPLEKVCRSRPIIQAVLAAAPRRSSKPAERFETSSRYFRGRIVDALRDAPRGLSLGALAALLNLTEDLEAASKHVDGLLKDGLVIAGPALSGLREDAPTYDGGASGHDLVYRLPD